MGASRPASPGRRRAVGALWLGLALVVWTSSSTAQADDASGADKAGTCILRDTSARPSAKDFPPPLFSPCFEGTPADCLRQLHDHWGQARKVAYSPCHNRTWPHLSNEDYICRHLFSGLHRATPAPAQAANHEETDRIRKELDACLNREAPACPATAASAPCPADQADKDRAAQAEADRDQAQARLASALKDLEADEARLKQRDNAPHPSGALFGTAIRVGGAEVFGHLTTAPALDLNVATTLWSNEHFDVSASLANANYIVGKTAGILLGAGAELDWYPIRNQKWAWGFGMQAEYAAVLTGYFNSWFYGNGGWFVGQLLMDWRVHPNASLGFRLAGSGVVASGGNTGGLVALDFVVVIHPTESQ